MQLYKQKHTLGFQTLCKDAFGSQKPTQKAKREQVWLEN